MKNAQEYAENGHIRDGDGRLAVVHGAPAAVVGPIGASIGDTLVVPVYGMSSVTVSPLGTGPSVAYEVSFDGGLTWNAQQMWSPNSGTIVTSFVTAVGVNTYSELPPGTTHFRLRATTAPGGLGPSSILPSPAIYRALQQVGVVTGSAVAINPGSARIGLVGTQASATWVSETTTPLAGTGTVTGTTKDLALVVSGNFIVSSNAIFKEYRALAVSDVAGTLHVEVSPDSTTWWRVRSIATVALGSIFLAEVSMAPTLRYARVVYVNGAGGQTTFQLATAGLDA